MLKFCGSKKRSHAVRRFVVGLLCLVIAAATLSDAIAHSGTDLDHQHSGKHHHEVDIEAASHFADNAVENHTALAAHEPCMHGHNDASDEDQHPLKDECDFGCDTHICLTAVLDKTSEMLALPIVAAQIKRASENALPHIDVGLYRPPITFL